MIVFRHADPRYPFLWEGADQPPGRWHGEGEGPVHAFADTPDGAWAEFLRHEEIVDPEDLATVRRSMWAVEIGPPPRRRPALRRRTLLGKPSSYPACRAEARRLRRRGCRGLVAPSAALRPGGAHGHRVKRGLREGPRRDGLVVVLFGQRTDLVGWMAASEGRPAEGLLSRVRRL